MPVMLLRNISPAQGLCNGTRLLVVTVHGGRLLEATVACGSEAGRRVSIPRLPLQPPDDVFPFERTRRQFPVPAFAMTISKSQGQTLRRVAVFLRDPSSDTDSYTWRHQESAQDMTCDSSLHLAAEGGRLTSCTGRPLSSS